MKLLRCHIENFGVLSGFDQEFAEGLNVLCRENGFGKSTLAAFIKAMFYGLPKSRTRSLTENERKRYDPWQGGKYGGFLEFEYQGVQYRVTRYFGKKEDSFALYDLTNRMESTRFTENLGEDLFQLDADAFARSTFVPQMSGRDVTATTSIRTKLTNLVEDTNDLNNYDTAMKRLQDYRKKLKLFKGEGGQIAQLRQECRSLESDIAEAEKDIAPLETVCRRIDVLNGEKDGIDAQKEALREQLRQANEQKALRARQENLGQLRGQLLEREAALAKLDAQYPNGYPTREELDEQRKNLTRALEAQRRVSSRGEKASLSAEETRRLESLNRLFAQGVPGETEFAAWEKLRQDRDVLLRSREPGGLSEREQADFQTLKRAFAGGVPEEARIREAQRQCRRIAELQGMQRTKPERTEKKPSLPLLVFGLALLILGAVLVTMKLTVPGICVLVLGAAAALGAVLIKKPDGRTEDPIPTAEEQELADLQRQRDAFLRCFYEDVTEPEEKLANLRADRQRYLDLSRRSAAWEQQRREADAQLRQIQAELGQAFAYYYPGEAYDDGFVQRLRDAARSQDSLTRQLREKQSLLEEANERDRREADEAVQTAREFLNHYALSEPTAAACIQKAADDIQNRKMFCAELENAKKALDAFLEKNGDVGPLQPIPEPETLEIREKQIQIRLDELENSLRDARQQRRSLQESVERIPAWEDKLSGLEDELREAERKCVLADRTIALLEQAKDSLANSYVAKIEEGFRRYAETLLPGDLSNVLVDKDLKLRIDAQGAARETESFSAGLSDCISLCMRLSLVDALFGEETPFLILDDPFVNLDDEHTKRALEMLRGVAEDHQILYLVCNSSRA